jgi:signal transduction histidine kinase
VVADLVSDGGKPARADSHRLVWLHRLQQFQDPPPQPLSFGPLLVFEVAALGIVAAALGGLLVRPGGDAPTLIAGSLVVFGLSLFTVRSVLPVQSSWQATVIVQLGLAVASGPIGAAAGAVSESLGVMIRGRNGWFRTVFNVANLFVSGVAAYETFVRVAAAMQQTLVGLAVAGVAAGLAHFVVNYALLAMVVHAADPRIGVATWLRRHAGQAVTNVGYGWSAFGFVVLSDHAGFVGFTALLAPVVLLQGTFVVFTARFREYEEQRSAHQREREALLQRAVEASETERRRIARDLHDGVVQNLSGMAFALTAAATRLKGNTDNSESGQELVELLDHSADETRHAMKDLRTLIIEIAPPTLRREGLHAALLEIMRTLEQAGTKTKLELPSNMRLRQDRASLIFRVAQEVLRNVAAHAEARHVSVVLREEDGMGVLRIEDDGKGFTAQDVARRRAEGHVGTNAIVELAEEAGGSLDIASQPGRGTQVVLRLPVE